MAVEGLEKVGGAWRALGAPQQELQLDFCLPTGQSFRWRQTGDNEYTGVIGDRLVCLRQREDDVLYRVLARRQHCRYPGGGGLDISGGGGTSPADPAQHVDQDQDDAAALRDYFNLDTQLSVLAEGWATSCSRFRDVSPHFPGARMLRQDPLECLFQFICSSNNHISRIHGMVERLCSSYGTALELTDAVAADEAVGSAAVATAAEAEGPFAETSPSRGSKRGRKAGTSAAAGATAAAAAGGAGLSYFAFPTLEQLSRATEEELRATGFGYRARFIVGTTRALLSKPGGGREWLLALRQVPLEEAVEALTELPGIGPKVAACICLFSLDKHSAIPVDTHVWQIAVRHYCPQLAGKSLTKRVHAEVQAVFVERFGPYAGWAHNTLFISELASQQHRLPEHLRLLHHNQQGKGGKKKAAEAGGNGGGGKRRGRSRGGAKAASDDDDDRDEEMGEAEQSKSGSGDGEEAAEADSEDEEGASTRRRASTQHRPRSKAAATADTAAAAAVATAASSAGEAGRGARRGWQQRPIAAAGVGAVRAAAPAAVPGEAGGAVTRSGSSASEGVAATSCVAVLEGQADVGSPPAPARAAAGSRRRPAAARGPEPEAELEPEPARGKKRVAGKTRCAAEAAAPAAQAAGYGAGYALDEFDDLAM